MVPAAEVNDMQSEATRYRYARIGDRGLFIREAGPEGAPVLLLPHGYPCSSFARGKDVPTYALNVIRDLAAEALQAAEVRGVPATLKFTGMDKIVGAIAWSALDLFRGDELSRLKQCPPDDCHWLFIDRTKNGSRRWCDMATCGNRAKKQTYRKR